MTSTPSEFSVPNYADLNEEQRAQADQVIAQLDWRNPQTMDTLHQDVLANLRDITDQMIQVARSDPNSVFADAMQKVMTQINGMDLDNIVSAVKGATGKGLTVASKIGKMGKWLNPKRYNPQSMESIEDRIGKAIVTVQTGVKELEFAQARTPELVDRIGQLNAANRDTYMTSTLRICAGREYLRRLDEEVIPTLQAGGAMDFDALEDADNAQESRRKLTNGLKLLDNARTESVRGATTLRTLGQSVSISSDTISSLLTSEVGAWQRDLVTAGIAIDVHRTVRVADAFRNNMDRMREDTASAAQHALTASLSGQLDSPERLQATIASISKLRSGLAENLQRIEVQAQQSEALRLQLTQEAEGLAGDLATAVKGGIPQLPGAGGRLALPAPATANP